MTETEYWEEIKGIIEPFAAWCDHQTQVIELYDKDHDCYIPSLVGEKWTTDMINDVLTMYLRGYESGKRDGKIALKCQLRQLLGAVAIKGEEENG